MTFLCLLLFMSSCATSRHHAHQTDLNPDEVFTVTEEDIASETQKINRSISGQWTYSGPSVDVSGKNVLAGIGKPFAKGKLKGKLKNAYKKLGLNKVRPEFVFNEDGTCAIKLFGVSLNGTYNYSPSSDAITLKWHGVPLNARLKRDGKKKLQLTFGADKLLKLFSFFSRFTDSSALKALSTLLDNYEDVMVGFELKK